MIAVNDVLPKLEGVRRCGRGWMAKCPAHQDRRPSLKVDVGAEGRVLLRCFSGCCYSDITRALKLEPVLRRENYAAHSLAVHTLALRIARSQSWAREDFALLREISTAIRRRRRAVDVARDAATRAGDCDAAWSLLVHAARLDTEADAIEAELEETFA